MTNNQVIDHPSYYNAPGKKECIDEMIDLFGPEYSAVWCLMTQFKYGYRKGNKYGEPEDKELSKMEWYKNKAEEIASKYELDIKALEEKVSCYFS